MSRKVWVAFAGIALVAGSVSTAFATCLKPNEQRAEQIRTLQTRLMVGALKCGRYEGVDIRASYNTFVTRFSPELVAHSNVLRGYFRRTGGTSYAAEMDRHVTALANAASLQSNTLGYCARIASLAEATASETPDELVENGDAGPALPVKLADTCTRSANWADEITKADAAPAETASESLRGVKEVSAAK